MSIVRDTLSKSNDSIEVSNFYIIFLAVLVILISFYIYFPQNVESKNTALQTKQSPNVLNVTKIDLTTNDFSYLSIDNQLEKNETISTNLINFTEIESYDKSLEYYDKAIAIDPTDIDALNSKATLLHSLERYDESLQYYDKVLAINSSHVSALNNKATLLLDLESYDEALEYFSKSVALYPTNVDGLNGKALVLQTLESYDEALQYFDKALAIDPTHVSALNNKANLLQNLKRYDETVK